MKIIDTHTHFHDPERVDDLLWPKPGDAHNRTCLPQTYRDEVGEGPVVAVETSPRRIDDVRLAEIAHGDDMVLCYVNNLQPLEDGFEQRLAIAVDDPKWRGLRLRPIEAFDLGSRELVQALSRMEGKGHVELGVRQPERLQQVRKLCRELPGVDFVLTHCGHPSLEPGAQAYGYEYLAGIENVFVKLSTPQFSDFGSPDVRARLESHVQRLRLTLPAARFMFGSNWPVSTNSAEFRDWLGSLFAAASGEAEALFRTTAEALYRIDGETARKTATAC